MLHAQAASFDTGASYGRRSQQHERYYNTKMIVCMVTGITYEKFAEELQNLWGAVFGFQKVDLNCRLALGNENPEVRDCLVVSGLTVDGKNVTFSYHKRRERPRVYISQLPIGISDLDISEVLHSTKYTGISVHYQDVIWT